MAERTSATKVELVQEAYEAWNAGDIDTAFRFLDPEIEVSVPPQIPESGPIRGLDDVRRFVDDFLEAWNVLGAEPERFVDAGEKVVVIVRYFGRGKESGLDVKGANIDAHVWTVRNGKAVSLRMYQGTGDAMRDAGLPEEGAMEARAGPR